MYKGYYKVRIFIVFATVILTLVLTAISGALATFACFGSYPFSADHISSFTSSILIWLAYGIYQSTEISITEVWAAKNLTGAVSAGVKWRGYSYAISILWGIIFAVVIAPSLINNADLLTPLWLRVVACVVISLVLRIVAGLTSGITLVRTAQFLMRHQELIRKLGLG